MKTLTTILKTLQDFEEVVQALSDHSDALSSDQRTRKKSKELICEYNSLIAAAKIGFEHFTWKHKLDRKSIDSRVFPCRDISRYMNAEEQLQYHKKIKYAGIYFAKLSSIEEELGGISSRLNEKLTRRSLSEESTKKAFERDSERRNELLVFKQFLLSVEEQTLTLHKKYADLKTARTNEIPVSAPKCADYSKFSLSGSRLPMITISSRSSQPLTLDTLADAKAQPVSRKPLLGRRFS